MADSGKKIRARLADKDLVGFDRGSEDAGHSVERASSAKVTGKVAPPTNSSAR